MKYALLFLLKACLNPLKRRKKKLLRYLQMKGKMERKRAKKSKRSTFVFGALPEIVVR